MDETKAREFVELLLVPDAGVEVRMPHTKRGVVTGYFDDVAKLLGAVRQWDGKAPGIYVTFNPCNPDLMARAANRLREFTPVGEWLKLLDAAEDAELHFAAVVIERELVRVEREVAQLRNAVQLELDGDNGDHNDEPTAEEKFCLAQIYSAWP